MAMPILSNRKPRVQYRDGVFFVELSCESIEGEESTVMLALTRHVGRALANSLAVSDNLETGEIYSFSSRERVSH